MNRKLRIELFFIETGIRYYVALGFSDVAISNGWRILNFVSHRYPAADDAFVRPDVIIAFDTPEAAGRALRQTTDLVVSINSDLSALGMPSFVIDEEGVGREAAAHCLGLGFTRFSAFGFSTPAFAERRNAAFFAAAQAGHGQCFAPFCFRSPTDPGGPHSPHLTHAAVHAWLQPLPKPLVVFCACDRWARILSSYMLDLGYRIPDQFALISADNDEFVCQLSTPSLSSVIIPWRQIGQEIGHLVERLEATGKIEARRFIIPPAGVAQRNSCDALAVPDPNVAAALALIRARAVEGLDVQRILREIPVARKRLEAGFRRHVGHGITKEIRRVKVEQARRLLAMTSLSMREIAARVGFPNPQKLATNFHKVLGLTPSQYRSRFRL